MIRKKEPRSHRLPIPMRRDSKFLCDRCRADASFGYTHAQNPKIKEGQRLCMTCYQKRFARSAT
jgi:hypothetical protein